MVGTVVSWATRSQRQDVRPDWTPLLLHGVSSLVAGVAVGLALGALGPGLSVSATSLIAAALAALWAVSETRLLPLPTPQRRQQVPNEWRWKYARAVVGSGYGAMLGAGFLTYIRYPAFLVATLVSFLLGDAYLSAAVIGTYGLARFLPLALTALLDEEDAVIERISALSPVVHAINGMVLGLVGGLLVVSVASWAH
jgi:hypothetical protein